MQPEAAARPGAGAASPEFGTARASHRPSFAPADARTQPAPRTGWEDESVSGVSGGLVVPAERARAGRLLHLAGLRIRRRFDRLTWPVYRFGTWMFFAAGALVGFEVLDVVFGSLLFGPEAIPVILLVLALVWAAREGIRMLRRRLASHR
jgi:hypothetical protein